MPFTAPVEKFRFDDSYASAFAGKRVLITGSGRDGGIGQALFTADIIEQPTAKAGAKNVAKRFCSRIFCRTFH